MNEKYWASEKMAPSEIPEQKRKNAEVESLFLRTKNRRDQLELSVQKLEKDLADVEQKIQQWWENIDAKTRKEWENQKEILQTQQYLHENELEATNNFLAKMEQMQKMLTEQKRKNLESTQNQLAQMRAEIEVSSLETDVVNLPLHEADFFGFGARIPENAPQEIRDLMTKTANIENLTSPKEKEKHREESRKLMNFARENMGQFIQEGKLSEGGTAELMGKDGLEAISAFLRGKKMSPLDAFAAATAVKRTVVLEQLFYQIKKEGDKGNSVISDDFMQSGIIEALRSGVFLNENDENFAELVNPKNFEKNRALLIRRISEYYDPDLENQLKNPDAELPSIGDLDGVDVDLGAGTLSALIGKNGYQKISHLENVAFTVLERDIIGDGDGKNGKIFDNNYAFPEEKISAKKPNNSSKNAKKNSVNRKEIGKTSFFVDEKTYQKHASEVRGYFDIRDEKNRSILSGGVTRRVLSQNSDNAPKNSAQNTSQSTKNIRNFIEKTHAEDARVVGEVLASGQKIDLWIAKKSDDSEAISAFLQFDNPRDQNWQIEIGKNIFFLPASLQTPSEQMNYISMIQEMLKNPIFRPIFLVKEGESLAFFQKLFQKKYPTEKIAARPYKFYEVIFETLQKSLGGDDFSDLNTPENIQKFLTKMQNPEEFVAIKQKLQRKNILDERGAITEHSLTFAKNEE